MSRQNLAFIYGSIDTVHRLMHVIYLSYYGNQGNVSSYIIYILTDTQSLLYQNRA
jgi:hypothetical protein